MYKLLEQLDRDHLNFDAVLSVLERQVEFMRRGAAVNYRILDAALSYCTAYADDCHHPREDAVYAKLNKGTHSISGVSSKLHEQHEQLAKLTREFAEAVGALEAGAERTRRQVVAMGEEFTRLYREHMLMEERYLFPAAATSLTDDEWAQLEDEAVYPNDPLFEDLEERYAALREYIQRLDRIDHDTRPDP